MSRWTSLRRQSPSVLQGSGLCPLLFVFSAPWILKEWRRRGYNTHHSALRHSVSLLGEGLKNSFVLIFFFLFFLWTEKSSSRDSSLMGWGARDPASSDPDCHSGPCSFSLPIEFFLDCSERRKNKRKTQKIGDFVSKNLNFHPSVHQEAFRVKV